MGKQNMPAEHYRKMVIFIPGHVYGRAAAVKRLNTK